MPNPYVLAIDQGTTSTRAVVYDGSGHAAGSAAVEFTQHYPQPGWVEHDAEEIWDTVAKVVPQALAAASVTGSNLHGIGITNQRETVVVWERKTGRPVARSIVWQDRRTADFCREHHADEPWLHDRTGLVLDPYFSATKLRWLLENAPGLRARASRGELACGTIDSFLIARLTGNLVHATDVTNASRTLLVNLRTGKWDAELCRYFTVPAELLPEVKPSAAHFGDTVDVGFLPAGLPITGVAGDQQAALFGQCAFTPGEAKCTYGTGAFFLLHTGGAPIDSRHRLLTTFAATLDDKPQYALEGSVFVAGAAVQWLRDGLKLFPRSPDTEALAAQSDPREPVLFVPALVGLGAPHWQPEAKGVILGLTRNTTMADFARAALEGVAFQVVDLIEAAQHDAPARLTALRVDGGMAANAWFLQRQADLLGLPVLAAAHSESTALGAAFLAGLRVGVWPNLDRLRQLTRVGEVPLSGRRRRSHFAGPIAWGRIALGTTLAVGGALWANVILDFVLQVAEGKLNIETHLQARLVTWEISALATLAGAAFTGASTINPLKQGLCMGIATATILIGVRYGSPQIPINAHIFTFANAVVLGLVGGWFGGQVFPPILGSRTKTLGPMSV